MRGAQNLLPARRTWLKKTLKNVVLNEVPYENCIPDSVWSQFRVEISCDHIYIFGYISRPHMGTFKLHISCTQAMCSLQYRLHMQHAKDV